MGPPNSLTIFLLVSIDIVFEADSMLFGILQLSKGF